MLYGGRFSVIEYDHKLGKGAAIIGGMKRQKNEFVGYVDADAVPLADDIIKVFSQMANITRCPLFLGGSEGLK